MMNFIQIINQIDTVETRYYNRLGHFQRRMNQDIYLIQDSVLLSEVDTTNKTLVNLDWFGKSTKSDKLKYLNLAVNIIRASNSYATGFANDVNNRHRHIRGHYIEVHRKFTLSIACLILFFIGAPLGAIIRKGGLGMPVVISILFFILFHITSLTGEKLAKSGDLPIWTGMWLSSFVLTPIGIFLTYKATTDSVILDSEFYTRIIKKLRFLIFWKKSKDAVKT
tara:strand:- start:35 stop:703 length:669 start_codon:yes stop_codon:yes gene_type:complete